MVMSVANVDVSVIPRSRATCESNFLLSDHHADARNELNNCFDVSKSTVKPI